MSPQSPPGSQDQPGGTSEPGDGQGADNRPDAGQRPGTEGTGSADSTGRADGTGWQSGADEPRAGQPRPFFAVQPGESQDGHPSDSPGGQQDTPQYAGSGIGQPLGGGPPYGQPPIGGPPYGQPAVGGPAHGQPAGQGPYGGPASQGSGYGQPSDQRPDGYEQPAGQRNGRRPGGGDPRTRRPERQRSTKPPERELRQRALASLVFGVVGLVALFGLGTDLHKGVYLLAFSAAVGIAGCVIGITALVKARKTGSYRPRFAVGGIVLGAFAALISLPILATYLAFPTQVDNYVNCLSQAQNSPGQHACMSKFYKSIHLGTASSGPVNPISRINTQADSAHQVSIRISIR